MDSADLRRCSRILDWDAHTCIHNGQIDDNEKKTRPDNHKTTITQDKRTHHKTKPVTQDKTRQDKTRHDRTRVGVRVKVRVSVNDKRHGW